MSNSIKVPAIYEALRAAMTLFGEVGVAKDAKNSMQNYNFRSITSTLAVVNRVFTTCGIAMKMDTVGIDRDFIPGRPPTDTDKGASNTFLFIFDIEFTFTSLEDGSQSVQNVKVPIATVDPSKAYGLGTSYALKELFFKMFAIPVDGIDDPDFDQAREVAAEVVKEATKRTRSKSTKQKSVEVPPAMAEALPGKPPEPVTVAPEPQAAEPAPKQAKKYPDPNPELRAVRFTELTGFAASFEMSPGEYIAPAAPFVRSLGHEYMSELSEEEYGQVKLMLEASAKASQALNAL